jgi:PIN domain nuclease of toxin-antitoxin system
MHCSGLFQTIPISPTAAQLIGDSINQKFVSVVSLWEITIKVSLGRLNIALPLADFIRVHLTPNKVQLLQIEVPHLLTLESLPYHHRDPFDRLLAAQALTENLPFVSVDTLFDSYSVQRLW